MRCHNVPTHNPQMRRTFIFVTFALAALLCTSQLNADVTDAPHNQASGVSCSGCHSYSFWWQYSPLDSASSSYKAQINSICSHCHSSGSSMAAACEHSSVAMEEMHNPLLGTWQRNCLDCHDPHFQAQLDWQLQYENDLYLVSGTIGSSTNFTYADGKTTLDYTASSVSNNWTDYATWHQKTGPEANRGLLLVVDTSEKESTYRVVAADASTITIKGDLASSDENKTFGLIYGQFIKSAIQLPDATYSNVRFFDPHRVENGFVDSQTPPGGICQVCHTNPNTRYWTADGLNTLHNNSIRCTTCHIPAQSFKAPGTFASHNVINAGGCDACHGPLNTLEDIETLHTVTANGPDSCDTCHASPRPEVMSAIASGSAVCMDCHAEQTVHQAMYYYSDQVDMPLIMTDGKGLQAWQEERFPFGGAQP